MSTQMATANTFFRGSSFVSDFVTERPDTTDTPLPEEILKPINIFADLIPLWLDPVQKPFSLDDASTVVRRASRHKFAGQHDQENRNFVAYATHRRRADDRPWKTDGFGVTARGRHPDAAGESFATLHHSRPATWNSVTAGSLGDCDRDTHKTWIATAFRRRSPLRPPWQPQIKAAGTQVEIAALLRLFGMEGTADRLRYLRDLARNDPDEPRLNIDSLRFMALFTMAERQLPEPRIGVSPDGLAHIEWRLSANGILAMEFLTSGLIRFAAISAPAQASVERMHVGGTLPKDEALEAVKPFTKQICAI